MQQLTKTYKYLIKIILKVKTYIKKFIKELKNFII